MSVLVCLETNEDGLHPMSWEAIAAGQRAAKPLDAPLTLLALGAKLDSVSSDIAVKAADEAILIEHPLLDPYTPDGYALALRQALEELQPRLAIFPHTYRVRDFGPKLAASIGKPFVSDAVAIEIEEGRPVLTRQLFQGKLHAEVAPEGEPPYFVSIQSGAYRADQAAAGDSPAPVRKLGVTIESGQIRLKPEEPFREQQGGVDLSAAPRIVSVGRGIKGPENLELVERLAKALGAELAASRPVCDNGWLPLARQVGSSGQTVAPKLYLAVGISGAIQHVVAIKGAQTIVAINQDPSAPIFEVADYGIVGDLFEIVPALIEELEQQG